MDRVQISTDGARVLGVDVGGWGVVIRSEDNVKTHAGSERDTTNNRMELRAILEGLKEIPDGESVLVRSDSDYALGVTFGTKDGEANLDLIEAICSEAERLDVDWTHVEGHSGDPDNEKADDLAEQQARDLMGEIADEGAPFVIRGDTYPVKDTLRECGLHYEPNEKIYRSWLREKWEKAVEEVNAEVKSEHEAVC